MSSLRLFLQPTATAGQATLILAGLDPAVGSISLSIKDGENYLQAPTNKHKWGAEKCDFELTNLQAHDKGAMAVVGPEIVDPIVSALASTTAFEAVVNVANGGEQPGILVVMGTLLSSAASGDAAKPEVESISPSPQPPAPVEEPAPVVVEPEPEPEPKPEPVVLSAAAAPVTPAPKKSNKGLMLLLLLIVLAAIGAGVWWWLNQPKTEDAPPPPPPAATEPTETAAPQSACDASQMGTQNDLAFIQACLTEKPDSTQLLQIIQAAKSSGNCSIAQRLYANRSQAGDLVIANAYVKEYDPKFHQASECFAEPNADTAIYWYENILQADPDNAEAKERLAELQP